MSNSESEYAWETGLASVVLNSAVLLCGAIGAIYNVLLASSRFQILNRTDARVHGVGSAIIVAAMAWTLTVGLRLGFGARGPLGIAARALGFLAIIVWILNAIGVMTLLAPMW
jgi:hypothetical protein